MQLTLTFLVIAFLLALAGEWQGTGAMLVIAVMYITSGMVISKLENPADRTHKE